MWLLKKIKTVENSASRESKLITFRAFELTVMYIVIYYAAMNEVQHKIVELMEKGWTQAAMADELGLTSNAVAKWKAGDRYPANAKMVLVGMDKLLKRKRIPKRRRYEKASH